MTILFLHARKVDARLNAVMGDRVEGCTNTEVDHDVYAEGEEAPCWPNAACELEADTGVNREASSLSPPA